MRIKFLCILCSIISLFFLIAISSAADRIPAPQEVLGFTPGEDFKLANYESIVRYFRLLDARSDKLKLEEIGTTTEGRLFIVALISSADNLSNLPIFIQQQHDLSDPLRVSMMRARRLVKDARAVVSINCSIHPQEIGPSQMSMVLAHRLLTDDSPEVQAILDNVILLLIPAHNPDGLDAVIEWYNKYRGSDYEAGPLPFLTHKYCGHDINRDWFLLTQKETAMTVQGIYNVWLPQVVFDVHQMGFYGARMFVPPYVDPYDEEIDPIQQTQMAAIGANITMDLVLRGARGVSNNVYFDAYSPARTYTNYHGGTRVLGEIASARLASPIRIEKDQLKKWRDFYPQTRSWNNPLPWEGGTWTLAHIVDYAFNASFSLLRYAAQQRETLLFNYYKSFLNQVGGEEQRPVFMVPVEGNDPYAVYELLSVLRKGLVDIYRSENEFVAENRLFAGGTFVIPSAQRFGNYVRALLENQSYPQRDSSGCFTDPTPYDVSTHNLPLFFNVKIVSTSQQPDVSLKKVDELKPPAGSLEVLRPGDGYLLSYSSNQSVKALFKLLDEPIDMYWLAESVKVDDSRFPPGTVYIRSKNKLLMQKIAEQTLVSISQSDTVRNVPAFRLKKPRVGLYQSYIASSDEGWTRFILEKYGIDYYILRNNDIRSGRLADQFDCVILPDLEAKKILEGHAAGTLPDEFCGGIGKQGVNSLIDFVRSGGTLIALDSACGLVLAEFWIGVSDAVGHLDRSEYFIPGALLKMIVDTHHPIGYGMPREVAGFNYNSPAFDLAEGQAVAKYPGENLLLSGWLKGEKKLALKTTVAEISFGKGSIILLGLRSQFRAQTRGTYKFLFNSIIKSGAQKVALQ